MSLCVSTHRPVMYYACVFSYSPSAKCYICVCVSRVSVYVSSPSARCYVCVCVFLGYLCMCPHPQPGAMYMCPHPQLGAMCMCPHPQPGTMCMCPHPHPDAMCVRVFQGCLCICLTLSQVLYVCVCFRHHHHYVMTVHSTDSTNSRVLDPVHDLITLHVSQFITVPVSVQFRVCFYSYLRISVAKTVRHARNKCFSPISCY